MQPDRAFSKWKEIYQAENALKLEKFRETTTQMKIWIFVFDIF